MIPRVRIEETFDEIVSVSGGLRLTDIVGPSPNFLNADYVFHDQKIVAELKCLEIDKTGDPSSARKLGRIWIKWRQRGLVDGRTPPRIDSRALPRVCQNEMYKIIGEPIRRRIKKANRQIRETKAALSLADYTGLLLIANDGNFSMNPAAMIHCIQSSLRNEFREIKNFIFFTANMYSRMDGVSVPALFWISFSMDESYRLPDDFVEGLHRLWMQRHGEITGISSFEGEIEDMEAFWHARY